MLTVPGNGYHSFCVNIKLDIGKMDTPAYWFVGKHTHLPKRCQAGWSEENYAWTAEVILLISGMVGVCVLFPIQII